MALEEESSTLPVAAAAAPSMQAEDVAEAPAPSVPAPPDAGESGKRDEAGAAGGEGGEPAPSANAVEAEQAQPPAAAQQEQEQEVEVDQLQAQPSAAAQQEQEQEQEQAQPSAAAEQEQLQTPQHATTTVEASLSPASSVSATKSLFEQAAKKTEAAARVSLRTSTWVPALGSAHLAKAPAQAADCKGAPAPAPPPASSQHDKLNTVNVSQLLKSGAFKLQPGKDIVPYAQLTLLRLEDGLDATQKEAYLHDDEFSQVFGMAKADFAKMPGWKRAAAKKKVGLW